MGWSEGLDQELDEAGRSASFGFTTRASIRPAATATNPASGSPGHGRDHDETRAARYTSGSPNHLDVHQGPRTRTTEPRRLPEPVTICSTPTTSGSLRAIRPEQTSKSMAKSMPKGKKFYDALINAIAKEDAAKRRPQSANLPECVTHGRMAGQRRRLGLIEHTKAANSQRANMSYHRLELIAAGWTVVNDFVWDTKLKPGTTEDIGAIRGLKSQPRLGRGACARLRFAGPHFRRR